MPNALYYGDNLDVLRTKIADESVDLCYIDPPFNSTRNYHQAHTTVGSEERVMSEAFVDTWTWDARAIAGYQELVSNAAGRFTRQTVALIDGLYHALEGGSLLAYLISMTLRISEIQRVLKSTGTFYLHCDPTSSHYLKLILDSVFVAANGEYRNEIIWNYESGGRSKQDFGRKHDVIFRYTKSKQWVFNAENILLSREATRHNHMKKGVDADGRPFHSIMSAGKLYKYYADEGVIPSDVWTEFGHLQQRDPERLGYPTQKPEVLLERIIAASSREGDTVLDAYCGCGTTLAVAQKMHRNWIGIDITYQSIALVLRRLEGLVSAADVLSEIVLDGITRDLASAQALAHQQDERVHNEFAKWAVLTYTRNRAIIASQRGSSERFSGIVRFKPSQTEDARLIVHVIAGNVERSDIVALHADMGRTSAAVMAVLITLRPPTAAMIAEAKAAGSYHHDLLNRDYDVMQIVTVADMLERGTTLDIAL